MKSSTLQRVAVGARLALICVLVGCTSKSPSNEDALTEIELRMTLDRANHGDVQAMNRLVDYYLINQENGREQGEYWMERAADAGDLNARKSVLDYLESQPSNAERLRGEELRKKWSLETSTRQSR